MERSTGLPVIALVSSAGGLDALSRVLAPLAADFPAAIVALQHIDPERRSSLDELLDRQTNLRVCRADDRSSLEPGRVYVVPEHRYLLITPDRTMVLIVSDV